MKRVLLYEVNLGTRYRGSNSRLERVLKTSQKHPWSKKTLYALYRISRTPIVLFVPTSKQMPKIRSRTGKIRIYSDQTPSGTGLGW